MGNVLCCVDKKHYQNGDLEDYGELGHDSATIVNTKAFLKHQTESIDPEADIQQTGPDQQESTDETTDQTDKNQREPEINDHLSEFDFDIDMEQEVEELAKYRNQYEEGLQFSKQCIIDTVERLLDLESSEEEAKKWDLKLNKDDVKVYIKKGGSTYNADCPYIKTEVYFNSYLQMNKILKTAFTQEHRKKWDKNVLKYEIEELKGDNAVLNYQLNKAPLNFQNRDFLDKQIKFSHDGKFYCYYSSVPNDSELRPIPEKVGRALTYIGAQKMERENGRIKYTMLMQCDLKMNITPKLIGMFLPQGMQDWQRKINKYLMDHYDKI